MIFFGLNTPLLILLLFGVILGSTVLGLALGRSMRNRPDSVKEPLAVMQTVLLGFMGIVLAFGLSLAVGRYETRRDATVVEANAIEYHVPTGSDTSRAAPDGIDRTPEELHGYQHPDVAYAARQRVTERQRSPPADGSSVVCGGLRARPSSQPRRQPPQDCTSRP